jgi:hypothetical protein
LLHREHYMKIATLSGTTVCLPVLAYTVHVVWVVNWSRPNPSLQTKPAVSIQIGLIESDRLAPRGVHYRNKTNDFVTDVKRSVTA